VYCRRHHAQERLPGYRGMRLIYVPGIASKHLDTISHTFMSCVHALFGGNDVVMMCISGNSPISILPRLAGAKVVLNVDGSDWRRKKRCRIARTYIRCSEWLSTRLPHATVTDSDVMRRYYRERFGVETVCISYGADVPRPPTLETLHGLGLDPGRYLLLVGRLVPENCAHHLVDAYERLETSLRCVVVGDAPYCAKYISDLHRRGPHVTFPGYVFGEGYRELMHNAYVVVLCSEVGGTHPVLVEAMAAGNCVVVNDTPANLEVIGDAGIPYSGARGSEGLAEVLQSILEDPAKVESYRARAKARAQARDSWSMITDQYEQLFRRVTGGAAPDRNVALALSLIHI